MTDRTFCALDLTLLCSNEGFETRNKLRIDLKSKYGEGFLSFSAGGVVCRIAICVFIVRCDL